MSWLDDIGDTIAGWFDSDDSTVADAIANTADNSAGDYLADVITPVADVIAPVADYTPDVVANLISQYNDTGSYEIPSWLRYEEAVPDYSFSANDPMNTSNWGRYTGQATAPTPVRTETVSTLSPSDPMNTANWGTGSSAAPNEPGVWDTMNKYANMLNSPAGSLLAGLGGAGISAYGAMKQNALLKKAAAKQAAELAQRQALASQYSSPLRLTLQRQAVAAPAARRGETSFFTDNKLPSYYAKGGDVRGALQRCGGGAMGLARGGNPGQSDKVDAQLSDGEYVVDADVVSALGDGNNEAGAKQLDHMREAIRTHKRAAPSHAIPPKAKSPLEYMKKSKGAK